MRDQKLSNGFPTLERRALPKFGSDIRAYSARVSHTQFASPARESACRRLSGSSLIVGLSMAIIFTARNAVSLRCSPALRSRTD